MPHIVMDGTVVRPPFSGVHNAVCQQIAAELRSLDGWKRTVLGLPGSPVLEAARESQATAIAVPMAAKGVIGRILWQQTVLPRLLISLQADVFHACAYTAPLRCSCPVVLNVHDIIALDAPQVCSTSNVCHMKLLLPRSIRHASRIIVSTHHVAERIMDRFALPPERLAVAPLGVDFNRFSKTADWPSMLTDHRPYLLFVSNIEPKKGLDVLLDAYERCADRLQADVVIAGREGWKCRHDVRRLMNWNGPGRVHWLHRVPDDALTGLYQHAEAFVFPSRCEGFGMPILEAMASGTPVIHSDHPAVMEAAGGNGVAFANGDAEQLADTVLRVCGNRLLRETLCRNARSYAQRCTWTSWAETAAETIQDLVGGKAVTS